MLVLSILAFTLCLAGVGYEIYTSTKRVEERLDRVEAQIKQIQYYLANQHLNQSKW
jgi:hypothetical protein